MQAIVTKFIGPTNYRGSRIKARCEAGSLTVGWNDALGQTENHDGAAHALARKLGWTSDHYGTLVGGGLPDGTGNCYVFVKTPTDPKIDAIRDILFPDDNPDAEWSTETIEDVARVVGAPGSV